MPTRMRVCLTPTCPTLTPLGIPRCPPCAAEHEQVRGSRHERGYGTAHDGVRAELLRHLMPGTPCPRCGLGMWATQALDAGHSEDLRTNRDAVADRLEHSTCNRAWRKGMMGS
jgi:hypothetical protein